GFSTHRLIATREVGSVANGTVVWIRKKSTDAAADRRVLDGGGFQFVFLDALHTYEGLRDDWDAWSALVEPGAAIAIHDSRSAPGGHGADVGGVRFTTEVILRDTRFELAEAVDSLTVLFRKR